MIFSSWFVLFMVIDCKQCPLAVCFSSFISYFYTLYTYLMLIFTSSSFFPLMDLYNSVLHLMVYPWTHWLLVKVYSILCMLVSFSVCHAAIAKETEEYEEETTEEFTEIVETFQSSDDGGKTWQTYRKTTRITPQGTSENIELIEGTSVAGWILRTTLDAMSFHFFFVKVVVYQGCDSLVVVHMSVFSLPLARWILCTTLDAMSFHFFFVKVVVDQSCDSLVVVHMSVFGLLFVVSSLLGSHVRNSVKPFLFKNPAPFWCILIDCNRVRAVKL